MESGADNSSEQDTAIVTKEFEEPAAKRKRTLWWKEENWPRLKKAMERRRNPEVDGACDAACLGLVEDPVPRQTVTNCLQRIGGKPVIYDNAFPPRN